MNNYLEFAKSVAEGASEIALKYFGFDVANTWKSDNTPLTKADTEINSYVIKRISEKYPEHSVVGEEESKLVNDSKYIWVCDPIDGTIPYSCGLPMWTFSLALVDVKTGQPIVGIVNDVMMKNMYWAHKNGGAFRNGEKIQVSNKDSLKKTYLNVDGTGKDMNFSGINTINSLQNNGAKVMKLLSIIYGGVQVSNGKFVGTVFFHPYAHDVAALKIIIEEAGGKVTDLNGDERRYDKDGIGCVISNGTLHNEILSCVSKLN
ncbi:MAG: inositol monophosphatase family protein [Candidatus Moraniibacteriota bacterium]|jgi:fructose-1,6-bisphosphatase/inositol monophosphatase family enzyme